MLRTTFRVSSRGCGPVSGCKACHESISISSVGLLNLIAEMSGSEAAVFGVTNVNIEMPDFLIFAIENLKVVARHEPAFRISGKTFHEEQCDALIG